MTYRGEIMLNLKSIREAAEALLNERFPGEKVYHNMVPQEFSRPSFLIEIGSTSITDASLGLVELEVTLAITCFTNVDAYHNSHVEELEARMMSVQELFCAGYLKTQDRALHVISNKGQCFFDYATVEIILRYRDDQPSTDEWPLMGAVHTTIKEES